MTKVKICGITNLEDARQAVAAGADLLGFIFYEPSPRYVSPKLVRDIVSGIRVQVSSRGWQAVRSTSGALGPSLPEGQYQEPRLAGLVGVFVNASLETVSHILNYCQLDAAQLHGEESPEFVNHFEGRAYKAMRPQSQADADEFIQAYQRLAPPACAFAGALPCFLIDAYHPQLYGGTGRVTDWTVAANIARHYPIMLAGSLTTANVAEAIRAVQPWGVDVSSGVEAAKGKKDHDKVRAFVRTVKNSAANSFQGEFNE